jgi:hypothetical protein
VSQKKDIYFHFSATRIRFRCHAMNGLELREGRWKTAARNFSDDGNKNGFINCIESTDLNNMRRTFFGRCSLKYA